MKNKTIIIGFDLGHGNTALTWSDCDPKKEPKSLTIYNRKVEMTVIANKEIGEGVVIGENAFLNIETSENIYIYFKSRVFANPEEEDKLIKFVNAIYQHLFYEGDPQLTEQNSYLFVIGYPSGWKEGERDDYRKVIQDKSKSKLADKNVLLIPESRAAFMQAKENKKCTQEQLRKSVLVIDLGSSTTDYTGVKYHEVKPLEFGYDLGGHLIDLQIFARTVSEHPQRQIIEELIGTANRNFFDIIFRKKNKNIYQRRFQYYCRKAKEEFFRKFNENPKWYQEQPDLTVDIEIESTPYNNEYIDFQPKVSYSLIQDIVNSPLKELEEEKSWNEIFCEQLEEVKKALGRENYFPSAIFLTGGASRMNEDIISSVIAANDLSTASLFELERQYLENPLDESPWIKPVPSSSKQLLFPYFLRLEQIGKPQENNWSNLFTALQTALTSCHIPEGYSLIFIISSDGSKCSCLQTETLMLANRTICCSH
ncbi:MAG: hypothetical protein AAFO04_29815 [Cyanobacteria bacterium J06592_8]